MILLYFYIFQISFNIINRYGKADIFRVVNNGSVDADSFAFQVKQRSRITDINSGVCLN